MDNYHQHLYVPGQEIEKPKTRWIWVVFWIMLAVTVVEVSFAFANDAGHGAKNYLSPVAEKWLFITLTLVKAYYIVFRFMHLGDEKVNFKLTILLPTMTFIAYFIALMMYEGYVLRDTQLIRPDFFKRTYKEHHETGAGHDAATHEEGAAHGEEHAAPAHKEESHQ